MGVKISELPANTLPYTGSEEIPIVQSNETRASTLSSFVNYLSGALLSDSELASLSGNWQNTYTDFSSSSANYAVKNANNFFSSTQSVAGNLSATGDAIFGSGITHQTGKCSSTIGGQYHTNCGCNSFIGGGYSNTVNSQYTSILGGFGNASTGNYSIIGGGICNISSGLESSIVGGCNNFATGQFSLVANGSINNASACGSSIINGEYNYISATGIRSTIIGGSCNCNTASGSTIVAGCNHIMCSTAGNSSIIAGTYIVALSSDTAYASCLNLTSLPDESSLASLGSGTVYYCTSNNGLYIKP